jgi:flagellar basal-body rod modification protein FlgD
MTTGIQSIGSIFQPETTSAASSASDLFTSNSSMYLTLFLTQLKNQDPTQPFDTAQMTEQLAQLNSSQQLIQTNANLETLIGLQQSGQAASLASFLNKSVEYLGDTFYKSEGATQDFSYFLDQDYTDANIEIRDENDALIIKIPAEKTAGTQKFTWDGIDTLGNPVPTGTYKVSVVTQNASGEFGTASTFLSGEVTGIDFASSTNPIIFIGSGDNRVA